MARVHDDHYTDQARGRLQIGADELTPMSSHRLWHPGVAVAGQVRKTRAFAEAVEVDGLGAAGGLARPRESSASKDGIDGARLADVGAPSKRHLWWASRRQVGDAPRGAQEYRLRKASHNEGEEF